MATLLLFTESVSNTYKTTSEGIKDIDFNNNVCVKKTLSQIIKQSFFHGANRFGTTNFIA